MSLCVLTSLLLLGLINQGNQFPLLSEHFEQIDEEGNVVILPANVLRLQISEYQLHELQRDT